MNELPKYVDILGITYKVIEQEDMDSMGLASFGKAIIKLEKNNDSKVKASTLLHEVIESINYQLDLELQHIKIQCLEVGLYSTLVNNPKLLKYIFNV